MADHGSNMVPSLRLDTNTQLPTNVFQYETHFTNNLIEDGHFRHFGFISISLFLTDSLKIPIRCPPGVHAAGESPSGARDQFRLVQAEPLAKTSTTQGQPSVGLEATD